LGSKIEHQRLDRNPAACTAKQILNHSDLISMPKTNTPSIIHIAEQAEKLYEASTVKRRLNPSREYGIKRKKRSYIQASRASLATLNKASEACPGYS